MCVARFPWPALIGSLAVGCLLSPATGAEWNSPAASEDRAGDGQVRFVDPAADLDRDDAMLPDGRVAARGQSVSHADWTTQPSDDFTINPDGQVVQTAYQSSGQGGPPLRTGPATTGNLLDYLSSGRAHSAPAMPSHRTSNSAARRGAGPASGRSSSHSPTPAGRTAAAERGPTLASAASADSEPEQLLVQAHEVADMAATEAEFSRVIDLCRRSLTSERDGPATQYARQLASWALNRRGQLQAGAGQTSEAMRDFQDAIHLDPRRWRAIHNRGVLLAQAGRLEQAFDDFSRTIQLQPDYAKAYSNRAALLVVAGRLQQAADDYQHAIDLDPNLAVAHRGRGRCCHQLSRLGEAMRHYDAAVRLDPDDAYAVACRADLLTDVGHYAEAAAEYDRAIRLDRQSVEAYRGSAWLLATCPDGSVRNSQSAVERAKTALQLDRMHEAISYDTLAAALASAGEFRGAVQTARRAIEMAPDHERVVYEDRLQLYQHSQPFRIAPMRPVRQASYQR